jgi:hypothetical protein
MSCQLYKFFGDVGKLVTPVDCKSAALWHYWFDPSRLHQLWTYCRDDLMLV